MRTTTSTGDPVGYGPTESLAGFVTTLIGRKDYFRLPMICLTADKGYIFSLSRVERDSAYMQEEPLVSPVFWDAKPWAV
jgi:hypothetical protein